MVLTKNSFQAQENRIFSINPSHFEKFPAEDEFLDFINFRFKILLDSASAIKLEDTFLTKLFETQEIQAFGTQLTFDPSLVGQGRNFRRKCTRNSCTCFEHTANLYKNNKKFPS